MQEEARNTAGYEHHEERKEREVRAGLLTKSLRITHALWATNEYLSAFGKRDTDKCPLCGASNETNGHLKAHCPEESVRESENVW